MRVVNVVVRPLLLLPFRTPLSRRVMLLSYTGRRTGRGYSQPVSYVVDGDDVLTPGGGRWKLNLSEAEPITVRLRARDVLARPEFVRDRDEVERLLGRMVAANPRIASFIPFIERDRGIDRDMLQAAIDHGFSIIRWHLETTPAGDHS
jgi:hypothetical protein